MVFWLSDHNAASSMQQRFSIHGRQRLSDGSDHRQRQSPNRRLAMKIGLAVSTKDALPSAYVVYRDDLCCCIDRSAGLGYDGVELALRDTSQVDVQRIKQRLAATGLEIPCISTGQVFAADHLYFTHPDAWVRSRAVDRIIDMIRLASEFNAKVNIGRVRGMVHAEDTLDTARQRYIDCVCRCA